MPRRTSLPPPRPFLREVSLKPGAPASGEYPFDIPAVRALGHMEFDPAVTFFVGENATGKSTILEAIAAALGMNPEGGGRNFHFATRESHSDLHLHLRIVRSYQRPRDGYFLRAESLFNVATHIEELDREGGGPPIIGAYGGRSLHEQSHGESFYALIQNRFRGSGLYLLDEPEAALSPRRQIAILRRMRELVNLESQFIIATHSPILLAYPNARIYQFDKQGYRRIRYEDCDHFRVARDFLSDPEEGIRRAFRPEEQPPPEEL